jgi:hypothetical protein
LFEFGSRDDRPEVPFREFLMDQRPLRLGDIVDDYCPRERRITNHAIVALVGDEIRQTRCTTCDGEHVYKQARMPKRASGKDGAADNGAGQLVPKVAAGRDDAAPAANGNGPEPAEPAGPAVESPAPDRPAQEDPDMPRDVDGWLAHRPLIRATLPRTEGEPPAPRPIPEFTMHRQAYGRSFRGQGRHGNGQASNGFDPERHGNHGNHGNHNHGNGQARPAGTGRRRRRRGGRHKQSH